MQAIGNRKRKKSLVRIISREHRNHPPAAYTFFHEQFPTRLHHIWHFFKSQLLATANHLNSLAMYLFEYSNKNVTVNYKGNILDSLLELKYILSVDESHIWLRSDLEIYFRFNADKFDTPWKRYTPDFLVRNVKTNRAKLIEIKPDGYDDFYKLSQCKKICREHIEYFGYDWEYEVVFEKDIKLTDEQQKRFYEIAGNNNLPHYANGHILQNNICASDQQYKQMVIGGVPASVSLIGQ
jgi:hypothetical protein